LLWYGFFSVFDFMLIAISDMALQKQDGDLFKLYLYFFKEDG